MAGFFEVAEIHHEQGHLDRPPASTKGCLTAPPLMRPRAGAVNLFRDMEPQFPRRRPVIRGLRLIAAPGRRKDGGEPLAFL